MATKMGKTDTGFEEYPDKTRFYTYEQAKEQFSNINNKKILLTDAMLILLYSQPDNPINGRISMMKQMYLLTHEVLKSQGIQDGKFIAYHYGWFSFQVMADLENLIFFGYIKNNGKVGTTLEQFQITDKGKEHIKRLFSSLPTELQDTLKNSRKGWDQLGCEGILNYMYKRYPESIERSRLKERYKPIKWGRCIA
jgi:hypothetical protein